MDLIDSFKFSTLIFWAILIVFDDLNTVSIFVFG